MTEELWNIMGNNNTIAYEKWPTYDEEKTIENMAKIAIQVNGKLRATMEVPMNTEKEELIRLSKELDNVKKHLLDKEITKEIVIPNKIVNIVVK